MKRLDLVLAAAVIVTAIPDEARACGQCIDSFDARTLGFRREPLPANARVVVSGAGLDPASVTVVRNTLDEAIPLPFVVEEAGDAAGSIVVQFDWTLDEPGEVTINSNVDGHRYAIGPALDVQSPPSPTITVASHGRSDACCEHIGGTIESTRAVIDDDGTLPQVLKARLTSAAGERVVFFGYTGGMSVPVGTSVEGCLDNDPLAVEGEVVTVTATVVDWAGNESAPVGPFTFTYTAELSPGSCSGYGNDETCAQGPSSSSWLLLGMVGFAFRQRRARH